MTKLIPVPETYDMRPFTFLCVDRRATQGFGQLWNVLLSVAKPSSRVIDFSRINKMYKIRL